MSTTATSYDALLSAAFVDMLANCLAFRTALGVSTVAAAKARIIEDDAGDRESAQRASDGSEIDIAESYGVIRLGPTRRDSRALASYGRSGDVMIEIWLANNSRNSEDDPASIIRDCRNVAGAIAEQFIALADGVGRPPRVDLSVESPTIEDETMTRIPITGTWSDLP